MDIYYDFYVFHMNHFITMTHVNLCCLLLSSKRKMKDNLFLKLIFLSFINSTGNITFLVELIHTRKIFFTEDNSIIDIQEKSLPISN